MSRATTGIAAGISLGIVGCVALEHTNPLDTRAPVSIEITADRDTLTAYNQTVTFTASAGPAFPNAQIEWTRGPKAGFNRPAPAGAGPTFQAKWVTAGFDLPDETVTAWVGPHSSSRKVILSQRYGAVDFTGCAVVCIASVDPGAAPTLVPYSLVDSGGTPLNSVHATTPSGPSIGEQMIFRTAGMMSVPPITGHSLYVQPTQRGSTWIVGPGQPRDSVLVYADYLPWAVVLNCPATVALGGQVQLDATVRGANGDALLAPVPMLWLVTPFGRAIVTQTGLVTGLAQGSFQVIAREQFSNRQRECDMTVP